MIKRDDVTNGQYYVERGRDVRTHAVIKRCQDHADSALCTCGEETIANNLAKILNIAAEPKKSATRDNVFLGQYFVDLSSYSIMRKAGTPHFDRLIADCSF